MSTHDANKPRDPNKPASHDWANSVPSNDFMTMHQGSDAESQKLGYEVADANVKDTAMFLVVLAAAVGVVFVLAFGIGKLLYIGLARQDGPPNKWSQMSGVKPGNLESNPKIEQQQLKAIVARFPTPRLQTDDGNMDVAEMHAREDMLLNHYTWVNESKQTVRIPIERAMELVAQRGLPVEGQQSSGASAGKQQPGKGQASEKPMFGDGSEVVTAPLTDGFARTGPELQVLQAKRQEMESEHPNTPPEPTRPAGQ